MCVSLCTFISFNQSSGLLRGKKTDGALMEVQGERCIGFLCGEEEDGYPFYVNTLSVVLIKCYYYISWFMPHSTPFVCKGMVPIKIYILPKCYFVQWLNINLGKKKIKKERVRKNNNTSCKAHRFFVLFFWHPTVEKPPLILTGIVCLHSITNAPFTVVTPNRAYQISHTLGESMQKENCCA